MASFVDSFKKRIRVSHQLAGVKRVHCSSGAFKHAVQGGERLAEIQGDFEFLLSG